MPDEPTARVFRALNADELRERYFRGERDFQRINLLRDELEQIIGPTARPDLIEPMYTWLRHYNLLWADFRDFEQHFEWDSYGAFIPSQFDDLLPDRNLRGVDFREINLAGSYLYPVDLSSANLHRANLQRAILLDVNLSGADLSYADLRRSEITGDFRGANLYMARLERAKLTNCNLGEANLERSKLKSTDFTRSNLRNALLKNAHFNHTVLNRTRLQGVNFDHVNLHDCHVNDVQLNPRQRLGFLRALGVNWTATG